MIGDKVRPSFLHYAASILLIFPVSVACADTVATVLGRQGPVEVGAGRLIFNELEPGGKVRVNDFSQYRGPEREKKAAVQWERGVTPRTAADNENVGVDDVVHTGDLGWTRLILKDDSIIDLGPGSDFAITRFEMGAKERHIRLRLLQGKARILVVRKLEGQSTFYVNTPGVLVSVRGTDFAVHTDLSSGQAVTHVLGIRGQVTCDLARNAQKGEVYHQSVIVNTYSLLSAVSADGYVLSFDLDDRMSMAAYSRAMDEHASMGDITVSALGRHPRISELPGTGVKRVNVGEGAAAATPAPPANLGEELEREHPVVGSGGFAASGNFEAPHEIERDWNAVNQRLGPYTRASASDSVFTDRLPYEAFRAATPQIAPPRP